MSMTSLLPVCCYVYCRLHIRPRSASGRRLSVVIGQWLRFLQSRWTARADLTPRPPSLKAKGESAPLSFRRGDGAEVGGRMPLT